MKGIDLVKGEAYAIKTRWSGGIQKAFYSGRFQNDTGQYPVYFFTSDIGNSERWLVGDDVVELWATHEDRLVRSNWLYRCPNTGKIDPSPTCLIISGRPHVLREDGPGDIVDLGTMVCPAITADQRALLKLRKAVQHVLDIAAGSSALSTSWVRDHLIAALNA